MKTLLHLRILFLLPGLLAGITLFGIMTYGPGVSPDSVSYLQTAKSLLAGRGFMAFGEPMTHFPPFYAMVLALGGLLPFDIISISRLIQAVIFGLNVSLVILAVWMMSRRSVYTAGAAGLLFITILHIVRVHSYAWSEGLFFLLGMSGYILLAYYIETSHRRLLGLASFIIGLAILTRYAGLALLPPIILMLLIRSGYSFRRRLLDISLTLLIASTPLVIWMVRNLLITDSATNRTFAVHLIQENRLTQFTNTVFQYWLPWNPSSINPVSFLYLFPLGLFILIGFYLQKHLNAKTTSSAGYNLVLLNLIFAPSYLAFLFLSISFFDAATPMDARLLFPFNTVLLLVIIAMISDLTILKHKVLSKVFLISFLTVILLFAYFQIGSTLRFTEKLQVKGMEYQNASWRSSQTISYLHSLPDGVTIYTNSRDAIAHQSDIFVRSLPWKYSPYSLTKNTSYSKQIDTLCQQIKQEGTLVVHFKNLDRPHFPSASNIEKRCDVLPALVFKDSRIYMAQTTSLNP